MKKNCSLEEENINENLSKDIVILKKYSYPYDLIEYNENINLDNLEEYYLKIYLINYDEKTIKIINDNNKFILLILNSINMDKIKKIKNDCHFELTNDINYTDFLYINNKFNILNESNFVIKIDSIKELDKARIFEIIENYPNVKFSFNIRTIELLLFFNSVLKFISSNQLCNCVLNLDMNNNLDLNLDDYTNIRILYKNMEFQTLNSIVEFEKIIKLIQNYIPKNASKIDIVTFVTLFLSNYFQYDNNSNEYISNKNNGKNINFWQLFFIKTGVCRHFADFTKYFLNLYDIECFSVTLINENKGHKINIVKLDDKYYFLDNTWILLEIKELNNLKNSFNFLRSLKDFEHEEFDLEKINLKFNCATYDRKEILNSLKRIRIWKYKLNNVIINYRIIKNSKYRILTDINNCIKKVLKL